MPTPQPRSLLLAGVAAAALLLATVSTSAAAGPEELFADAAAAGELAAGDVAALGLTGPQCLVAAPKPALLCIAYARAADRSERWDGVIVGPKGVELTARLLHRTAAAAEEGDDPSDDPKGRAAFNKALKKIRWGERVAWAHDYRLHDGDLAGAAEQPLTLPDGRAATLTAAGLRAADGTTLAVAPAPGRPLTRVTVYALPGAPLLVAAVDDAAADRGDVPCESRFVASGAASPGPPSNTPTPAAATCPDAVWCPPGYATLLPLLDRFCRDDFGPDAVAETAALADRGALVAEDLAVLFNAYGALYAYAFKQKTDYNAFFYGAGAPDALAAARPWLPRACRDAIGHFTTESLPASLRRARDDVKRLWSKHK
jgi:hypothetical protein